MKLTSLLGFAIALGVGFSSAPGLTQEKLRDILVTHPAPTAVPFYPLHVAQAQGFFAAEGLNVTVETVDGSALSLQALEAGQAQIGLAGPGPLLGSRASGGTAVFFYNNSPRSGFGLYVPSDSDAKSPEDLKGKTIGTGTADGAEVGFARSVLAAHGYVEGTDFKFLTIGDGGPAVAAVQRGDIDAYSGAASDAAVLVARGVPIRDITPESAQVFFGAGYAATADFIANNPDVIKGFGRALARATVFARDPANQDAVLQALRTANPQESEDQDYVRALFADISKRVVPFSPKPGFGYNVPAQWTLWQESQIRAGSLSGSLDNLEAVYTNAFVDQWNEGLTQ